MKRKPANHRRRERPTTAQTHLYVQQAGVDKGCLLSTLRDHHPSEIR